MVDHRYVGLVAERTVDGEDIQARMRVLKFLGDPYSDEEIAAAPGAVKNKTELDALVAYLQGLGVRNVASQDDARAPQESRHE